MIYPVILCGGSGTRLWPLSTPERPKPFLPLIGERTLFQQALDRVADPANFAEPVVVAGAAHVPWIEAQAETHRLIVEPSARNTAPAIALAAALLDPDAIMLVCPSDHHIAQPDAFCTAVQHAADLAKRDWLVSLGTAPDKPETGYGYIKLGEAMGEGHTVARFEEKPDAARAAEYLAEGGYVWNAGIFVFRAGHFLDELARHRPTMAGQVRRAVSQAVSRNDATFPDAAAFDEIEGESVDYGVMENTSRAAVVGAAMGWSDIGNYEALMDARATEDESALVAPPHRVLGSRNVMIDSDGPRVSVAGLDGVSVIVRGDEILVVSRESAQSVSRFAKDEPR